MMWWHDRWSSSGATMMGVAMLAFVLVAAGLTVWVVRGLADSGRHPRLAGSHRLTRPSAYYAAEQVLAGRFAAGDIDEAQFERARAALYRDHPTDPLP